MMMMMMTSSIDEKIQQHRAPVRNFVSYGISCMHHACMIDDVISIDNIPLKHRFTVPLEQTYGRLISMHVYIHDTYPRTGGKYVCALQNGWLLCTFLEIGC